MISFSLSTVNVLNLVKITQRGSSAFEFELEFDNYITVY